MNKQFQVLSSSGQALIEYLMIFSFMVFLSINLVKGLGKTTFRTIGFLGYELTEQLTVGVCPKNCFYSGYKNSGAP
jgi:hypothetical protein